MRLKAGLIVCGLLAAINVQAKMYYGPTPNVSTQQEYELPSGAPADVYLWKEGITMLLAPINAPIQMCSKPAAIKAGVQRSLSF